MFLITGATGTVGRALVAALHDHGAKVRAVSRTPSRTAFHPAVEVVGGDPSRPETLLPHLDGVEALFLNSSAVRDASSALVAAAKRHGVRRVVALSAYNVEDDHALQPSRFLGDRNAENEAAAEHSGLEWASLRPGVYASNVAGSWAVQVRAGEVVAAPFGDLAEPVVDHRDVAEVAAHALLHDDLLGRKPVLTGPEALTTTEMVAMVGKVLGRRLRYREVPVEEFVERAGRMLPPGTAEALAARYRAYVGSVPPVTDEIERILGRPARSFAGWAADHAAGFGRPRE